MTTETQARIGFTVPLPPASLRANSRAHWATKKRDADEYSEHVYVSFVNRRAGLWQRAPWAWKRAHVLYVWRSCGVQPDHGNIGGNVKYLQDCLQMAPKTGAGANRYYLGIVENDSGIVAEYRVERVAHRHEEGVEIVIEEKR